MGHLGDLLRRGQESLGLSLTDLQQRTKIREKYISAILQGKYEVIPGEVYLRGFIRSIASELGIDPGEAMQAYYLDLRPQATTPEATAPAKTVPTAQVTPSAAVLPPEPERELPPRRVAASPSTTRPGQRVAPAKRAARKPQRQRRLVAWLLLLGLLVLTVWYFTVYRRPPAEQPPPPPVVVDQPPPPVENPEPPAPTVTVSLTNPGEKNPVYRVKPGPLVVNLSTIERGACWLRVITDQGTPQEKSQELTIGTRATEKIRDLEVLADQQISILAGYPAALVLQINGQDLGIVGGESARTLTILVDSTP